MRYGKRSMLRALSASICCWASANVAPGLSRPTIDQLLLWRESSDFSSVVKPSGIHSFTAGSRKEKPAGSTPTIVDGTPLMRSSFPTASSRPA